MIIAFLAMCNVGTLLILYQKQVKNAVAPVLKRMYEVTSGDNEDVGDWAKKYITGIYADVIASCGAVVSFAPRSSFAGLPESDMACLIAGKRTVIWETMKSVEGSLQNHIEAFNVAVNIEDIRQVERVSFRPEGERNALLLVKASKIADKARPDDISEMSEGIGPILYGILLGYDEADIAFFYQRFPFWDEFYKDDEEKMKESPPFSFADFPDQLRREFQVYLKGEWITSGRKERFERKREAALQWIKEQDIYSIDDLYKQIDSSNS